jgi:hypothetical protein
MKRIALLVLMLMPAMAFGQTGSNRLGPLHLPFEFKITVNGVFYPCSDAPEQDTSVGSYGLDWIINPGDTNIHLRNDTITYSKKVGNPFTNGASDSSFTMIFDTTDKTIQDLTLSESYNINYGGLGFTDYSSFVELTNLRYDSTSIFSPDSGLTDHLSVAGSYYSWLAPTGNGPTYCDTLAYPSSVNLSGNFQPAVLWAGVAMPTVSQPNMSISNHDGTIQCGFPPSDLSRTLELYTPLGVKSATFEIPSGQTSISLPYLMSGLYFLRLDGNVIKVAMP